MELPRGASTNARLEDLAVAVDRPTRWFSKLSHEEDAEDEASFEGGEHTRTRICRKWRSCVGKLRAKHIRFCTRCTKMIPSHFVAKKTVLAAEKSVSFERIRTCRKWRTRVLQLRDVHRQTCSSCRIHVSSRKCAIEQKWRLIEIDIPMRASPKDRYRAYIDHWRKITQEMERRYKTQPKPDDRCRENVASGTYRLSARGSANFVDLCEWRLGVSGLSRRKVTGGRCREVLKRSAYDKVDTDDEDEGIVVEENLVNAREQQTVVSYERSRFLFEVTDDNIRHWMPGEGINLEL